VTVADRNTTSHRASFTARSLGWCMSSACNYGECALLLFAN
jgi:hypothetical protein